MRGAQQTRVLRAHEALETDLLTSCTHHLLAEALQVSGAEAWPTGVSSLLPTILGALLWPCQAPTIGKAIETLLNYQLLSAT